MDITIDTDEYKAVIHLAKFDKKNSFAVLMNKNGVTIQVTIDRLIDALKVIANQSPKSNEMEK